MVLSGAITDNAAQGKTVKRKRNNSIFHLLFIVSHFYKYLLFGVKQRYSFDPPYPIAFAYIRNKKDFQLKKIQITTINTISKIT